MTNNKIFTAILALAFIFTAEKAAAECDGFYLAGRAGYAEYEVDDDRSGVGNSFSHYVVDKKRFIASGGIGYRHEHFRTEIEYMWRKANSENISSYAKGKFRSQSYMFIVYYDFFPYSWFTPFVDAGIGWTNHKLTITNNSVGTKLKMDDDSFTWSLGAGISAKLTNRLNLDVGYRYYDMGNLDEFNGKTSVTDQEVYVGVRYIL